MILKPKNMKEAVRMLKELPESKRKVIVMVGKHPNEGTYEIAQKEHEKWEKEGAVALKIPPAYTPKKAYLNARKVKNKVANTIDEYPGLLKHFRSIKDDDTFIKEFEKRGIIAPVINFHGTGYYSLPRLKIFSEKMRQIQLKEIEKLKPKHIIIEHYFWGKKTKKSKDRKLKGFAGTLTGYIARTNHSQITPRYLTHRRIKPEEISFFTRANYLSGEFIEIIKKLRNAHSQQIDYNKDSKG